MPAEKPNWISVNRQKPPEEKLVLVYRESGSYELATWEEGRWWEGGIYKILRSVTHWYPLPEPPVSAPKREGR